jgi:hypothetical protein
MHCVTTIQLQSSTTSNAVIARCVAVSNKLCRASRVQNRRRKSSSILPRMVELKRLGGFLLRVAACSIGKSFLATMMLSLTPRGRAGPILREVCNAGLLLAKAFVMCPSLDPCIGDWCRDVEDRVTPGCSETFSVGWKFWHVTGRVYS